MCQEYLTSQRHSAGTVHGACRFSEKSTKEESARWKSDNLSASNFSPGRVPQIKFGSFFDKGQSSLFAVR